MLNAHASGIFSLYDNQERLHPLGHPIDFLRGRIRQGVKFQIQRVRLIAVNLQEEGVNGVQGLQRQSGDLDRVTHRPPRIVFQEPPRIRILSSFSSNVICAYPPDSPVNSRSAAPTKPVQQW